ncbi:MAG: 30S ribosomal protein S20 [Planctomycetota bacterium]|nr:30S ribosomal protein S20 [Planctomycetota bacterium]
MPNTASAKKRVRQTQTRTLRNKVRKSAMRTWIRKVKEAVAAGDQGAAQAALHQAYKQIDKAAKQSIMHANKAANQKRKLAHLVNSIG